ncbi:hypothetical protein QVD17_08292 [Tagetes erecta]|uniref:DUF7733 domain-containing protein n=1 Tax=Tagetes erecta TaxID=13708 RepID=A0AAD8P479_TARER|nr:hypothetical protein QVD17_08292 [Tagetes erecta]
MSSGVVPRDDIVLKQETKHEHNQQPHAKTQPKSNLHRGIFSFQQLNALAIAIVLSASGMVAIEAFAFVIFSFFYMYFLSKVAFPTLPPTRNNNNVDDDEKNKLLGFYSFAGVVFGLFLPVAYIFEGIVEGDKEGIKAATPHVFLLASQLFLEGVAYSDRFSVPMRVLVAVVYNSTRIFSLMEWVRSEISKVEQEFHGSGRRLVMGRILAVANLVYWSFNLFGFLLPYYLPKAFKGYYSDQKSVKDD